MVRLRDIFQRLYPYAVFRTGKAVYLTFDDGPIPEVTPKVLAILDHYGIQATFFMVGENVDKHPEVYRQVVAAGHAVGNHTYNHLKGWRCSTATYLGNVEKCQERVGETNLFRPPYGKATWLQRRMLHLMGYRLVYRDILTRDYDQRVTPEQMIALIQRETRPGSIINFHDSLKSNERMLTALPRVIEWLMAQGYEIKTL